MVFVQAKKRGLGLRCVIDKGIILAYDNHTENRAKRFSAIYKIVVCYAFILTKLNSSHHKDTNFYFLFQNIAKYIEKKFKSIYRNFSNWLNGASGRRCNT